MRFLTLPTITILAGGLALAADPAAVTYVSGNIADFAPNSGATLYLNDPQSLELRAPLHKVQVPYSQIQKAELGGVTAHSSEPEALYKVWALPKRLIKSETRQMTVAFKGADGQDQTMTLDLSKSAASGLLARIGRRNGTVADSQWWGDGYWRTTRNKDQWNGATTVAQK